MLINKTLSNFNYIFPRNADPLYLRSLVALGAHPIFIYIENNIRIISIGISFYLIEDFRKYLEQYNICITLDNYQLFNFDCCNYYEIKKVLYKAENLYNVGLMSISFKNIIFSDVK